MTRKTKEEKILAQYRRRLKFAHPQTSRTKTATITGENLLPSANPYVSKDLKKSLLIIFLIITLEIVIYFVRINFY